MEGGGETAEVRLDHSGVVSSDHGGLSVVDSLSDGMGLNRSDGGDGDHSGGSVGEGGDSVSVGSSVGEGSDSVSVGGGPGARSEGESSCRQDSGGLAGGHGQESGQHHLHNKV